MIYKNIYITGVAGFLGSHLADRFLDLGFNVSGNDNIYHHHYLLGYQYIQCS